MRIEDLLKRSARRFPDKAALVFEEKASTYAELDDLSNRFANVLLAAGIERGDRVIIYLDNSIESVVAIFGTAKANGVFSMVNPMTKASKLSFIVASLRPKFIVTQTRLIVPCDEASANAPFVEQVLVSDDRQAGQGAPESPAGRRRSFWGVVEAAAAVEPLPPAIDLDLAYVSYTSGSTGVPKGVMMTHQSSVMGAGAMIQYLESRDDDVILSVIPLSFDYGLYQIIMTAMLGATLHLELSFAFPNRIMRKLASAGITTFPLVPTTAAIIVGLKGLAPGSVPTLRCITSTAAPLPPAHSARLQELFPCARIFSNYGLTETIRSTYLPPEELKNRPTSVGKAIPNTEAFIVDAQGKRVGHGVVGELVLRGANLLRGYWQNEEATEKALRPGIYSWEKTFHTGDLFVADPDGFLYFKGRMDDVIKSRGEKVAPREVEDVLYQLKGIREAAVIGVPDPVQGLAIRAVLALEPDCTLKARDVQVHCARYLEDYMVPSSVEFRDELPKTESGKIQRRALQDEAEHGRETRHELTERDLGRP
jgi:amino acid adenylation domain-containing protein